MTSQAFRFGFGGEDVELDEDEILRDLDPIADVEPVDANTPHPLDLEDIVSTTSSEHDPCRPASITSAPIVSFRIVRASISMLKHRPSSSDCIVQADMRP